MYRTACLMSWRRVMYPRAIRASHLCGIVDLQPSLAQPAGVHRQVEGGIAV
jgi:hypothetical protein